MPRDVVSLYDSVQGAWCRAPSLQRGRLSQPRHEKRCGHATTPRARCTQSRACHKNRHAHSVARVTRGTTSSSVVREEYRSFEARQRIHALCQYPKPNLSLCLRDCDKDHRSFPLCCVHPSPSLARREQFTDGSRLLHFGLTASLRFAFRR